MNRKPSVLLATVLLALLPVVTIAQRQRTVIVRGIPDLDQIAGLARIRPTSRESGAKLLMIDAVSLKEYDGTALRDGLIARGLTLVIPVPRQKSAPYVCARLTRFNYQCQITRRYIYISIKKEGS